MGPRTQVFPSLLSADFAHLSEDLKRAEQAGADGVQLDVMDLHFVPNLTFGWQLIRDVRKESKLFFDVHLMIENPSKWVDKFAQAGADNITFHLEACKNPEEAAHIVRHIKSLGKKAGIALKPATPAKELMPLLSELDYALVMTVEPGFGGQAFLADMLPKIRQLSEAVAKGKLKCRVQVDGGVTLETAELAKKAGATSLVAGSALFKYKKAAEMKAAIEKMRS